MALLTQVNEQQARAAVAEWGLELERWVPLAAGSVNSNFVVYDGAGNRWFGRLYEEQDAAGAAREIQLSAELVREGVPAARAQLRRDGAALGELAGKPFAVFEWIEGHSLCQAKVTPDHCRSVGRALAQVHLATERLSPLGQGRFRITDLHARLDAVDREAPAFRDSTARIRQGLLEVDRERSSELPSGAIHGDLFRDNVLWQGDAIAALLDFESASHGPFAYDLMVTVLAWCYADAFVHGLVSAMIAGYHATRPLQPQELEALVTEGCLGCLRFASTRLTDFELRAPKGQPAARDFRRMLDRMDALRAGALEAAIRSVV